MNRKSARIVSVLLSAMLGLCFGTRIARAEEIENTMYKAWSKYGPGTTATLKGTTEGGGQKSEITIVSKLLEVTPDKLTVETSTTISRNGQAMLMPVVKQEVKKMVDRSELGTVGVGFDPAKLSAAKEESVTVTAGTFTTKVIEYEREQKGVKMSVKNWVSSDVPGGAVKMEMHGLGGMNMQSAAELQSFDKK